MDTKDAALAPTSNLSNLTKRQQIAKANTMIFVWVAAASVVVMMCGVASVFLVRQAVFNQKIITAKSKTNATIVQNVENAKQLKKNVDALVADTNLESARANPSDSNLRVVFDALPTTGDETTLSNSLYTQVFTRSGVTTEGISVGAAAATVAAVATPAAGSSSSSDAAPTPQSVGFQAGVSGSTESIIRMLTNMEKTIRPMNISQLTIGANAGQLKVDLIGETFYMAPDSVSLGKTVVKP